MIENNEHIFHNPNSEDETANFLIKFIAAAAVEKILDNYQKSINDGSICNLT